MDATVSEGQGYRNRHLPDGNRWPGVSIDWITVVANIIDLRPEELERLAKEQTDHGDLALIDNLYEHYSKTN